MGDYDYSPNDILRFGVGITLVPQTDSEEADTSTIAVFKRLIESRKMWRCKGSRRMMEK